MRFSDEVSHDAKTVSEKVKSQSVKNQVHGGGGWGGGGGEQVGTGAS